MWNNKYGNATNFSFKYSFVLGIYGGLSKTVQQENQIVQKDGTLNHYALLIMQFLHEKFPGRCYMDKEEGCYRTLAFCGDIWNQKLLPLSLNHLVVLRNLTTNQYQRISSDIFRNDREHFQLILYYYMEVCGGLFQHTIR